MIYHYYHLGATVLSNNAFGPGTGPIHLDSVQCTGSENSLFDCGFESNNNCTHSQDVGIRCINSTGNIYLYFIIIKYSP